MKTVSCGVTKLKSMRLRDFKALKDVLLVEEYEGKPITAVIPYEYYMWIQSVVMWAENENVGKVITDATR